MCFVLCLLDQQFEYWNSTLENKMASICPDSNGPALRYSNGIQVLNHLVSDLFLTISVPNLFGVPICTVLLR